MIPGEVLPGAGDIVLNDGRVAVQVVVSNSGDRPIQVGSHFHFFEVNRALRFDRAAAFGRRLDVPSGTAVRFEPGEARTVELIPFGGRRVLTGFNGLHEGFTQSPGAAEAALREASRHGFSAEAV